MVVGYRTVRCTCSFVRGHGGRRRSRSAPPASRWANGSKCHALAVMPWIATTVGAPSMPAQCSAPMVASGSSKLRKDGLVVIGPSPRSPWFSRQAEDPLAEDVAHDVRRPAHDRVRRIVGQTAADLVPQHGVGAQRPRRRTRRRACSCSVQKHFVAAENPVGAWRNTSRVTRIRPRT